MDKDALMAYLDDRIEELMRKAESGDLPHESVLIALGRGSELEKLRGLIRDGLI